MPLTPQARHARRAVSRLNHAFEHLRPRMNSRGNFCLIADGLEVEGGCWGGVVPNAEAEAGEILARAMVEVVMAEDRI